MRKILFIIFLVLPFCAEAQSGKIKKKIQEVLETAYKVDSVYQSRETFRTDAFWDFGVFHVGNLEFCKLTGNKQLLDYTIRWAEHNNWQGAKEPNPMRWHYRTPLRVEQNVMFADYQICFQVYLDLNEKDPDEKKTKRAFEVFNYQTSLNLNDYWYWMDALFMAMPSMSRLYAQSKNGMYLDKMFEYFSFFDSQFYDKEAHLYYRDKKYKYPYCRSPKSGGKLFWSRGNGWVIASFARVFEHLPDTSRYKKVFLDRFTAMADTLKNLQKPEGYWQNCLSDNLLTPGYETSGTALILYALCYGVNSGILDRKTFFPAIEKAWEYLSKIAVQENFTVGYIFTTPERNCYFYDPNPKTHTNYGTGCFLLAATEYAKFLQKRK